VSSATRKLAVCTALGLAIYSSASYAALPPQYDRVAQLKTVMSVANEAARKLSPHPITSIELRGPGLFYFWAGRCFLAAHLEGIPRRMPGPTSYSVRLGNVACNRSGTPTDRSTSVPPLNSLDHQFGRPPPPQ